MLKYYFFLLVLSITTITNLICQNSYTPYFAGDDTDKAYSISKHGNKYLICGTTRSSSVGSNDIIVFEISESGNVEWMNTYGFENSDEAFDICASETGEIGIVGYTWVNGYMHNSFLHILTPTGLLKKEEYLNDRMAGMGFSIIEDQDGGFSYTGYSAISGPLGGQVFLTKTNSQGEILWSKEYGDSPEEHIFSHIQTNDNGYLLAGTTNGFMFNFIWREYWTTNSQIYLIKTDSEGNEEWTKSISGSYNDFAKCVKQASNGGYYILGSTQNLGAESFDMYLIKINNVGDVEWEKTFGGPDFEYGYDICLTEDNYIYLCGVSKTDYTESVDVYVIKTDLEGNIIWENTYGNSYSDYAYSIESTSTNGCILVGTTNDVELGNGSNNILVMKLDSEGEIDELSNLDTTKLLNITIYPNPAIDYINIKIIDNNNSNCIKSLKVIDTNGRIINKQNVNQKTFVLNTSQYQAGVYFIELTINNNQKHIKKIVIQRNP